MITVNGKPADWHEGITVAGMMKAQNYNFPMIIVRINGKLVKKGDYETTTIPDGADVSAMHLISGG